MITVVKCGNCGTKWEQDNTKAFDVNCPNCNATYVTIVEIKN